MLPPRKRILLLITNLTFGGAQRVFYDQSKLLSRHFEVIECVFNTQTENAFPTGNKLVSLDVKAGTNWFDKLFRFLQRVQRLKKVKRENQIDVCISHLEGADLVNVLSGAGEKTITWVHGSKRFDQNISGLVGTLRHKLLIPYTYKTADRVVTVSKAIKDELKNYYGIPEATVQTVYNFFDIQAIKAKGKLPIHPQYLPVYSGLPTLVFSGRLAKQKNPEAMINWFAAFVQTFRSKLIVIGDGELREQLIELAISLKLKVYHPWNGMPLHDQYQLYFLGFQENPFQFIQRSDLFILPSLWEGFPMALGEAMCCDVPVASADCPTGPREMLGRTDELQRELNYPHFADYGLLLPILTKNTESCWTEAISKLLQESTLQERYRQQSKDRIGLFSKEKNEQIVIEVVESIC